MPSRDCGWKARDGIMAGKTAGKKRGILTIAVMLLGSALLALMLSISMYANSLSIANRGLALMQEASEKVDAASYGMQRILENEGVNVTYTKAGNATNVSFSLDTQKFMGYSTDVERFADFAQAQPGANLSINVSEAKWPKFTLVPQGISVDFGTGGQAAFSPNAGQESAGRVIGYDVTANIGQPTPSFNWTAQSSVPQESQDALYLHIGVQGNSGGVASYTGYLNRSNASEVRLQDASGFVIMAVLVEPPSGLRVYYDSGSGIPGTGLNGTVQATVLLNGSTRAALGTSLINVNGAVRSSGQVYIDEG